MRGSRKRKGRKNRWDEPENVQAGPIRMLTNYDLLFLTSAYIGDINSTLYSEFFTIKGNDGVKGQKEAALWLAQEIRKVLGDQVFVITDKIPPEVPVEERERKWLP